MTYRVYIRKDYKPQVAWEDERKRRPRLLSFSLFSVLAVALISYLALTPITDETAQVKQVPVANSAPDNTQPEFVPALATIPLLEDASQEQTVLETEQPGALPVAYYQPDVAIAEDARIEQAIEAIIDSTTVEESFGMEQDVTLDEPAKEWQTVTVKSGDSMALIFSRLGLSAHELYQVMSIGKDVSRLKRIKPGQLIHFHIVADKLHGLEYELDLTNTLSITLEEERLTANIVQHELEAVVKNASATIKDSLFLSGKRAGLSDNLIMQMVGIYGWDIDFALDIRQGDSFTLIYEEKYKDGEKVADGPILAAEFTNRGHAIRAIRYAHADGRIDYYDDNGDAMRKAFLRTPVNFTRISSRFNLKRKHPILNKIRAHKGVDYAAATGTPIKATGDGTVVHAGRKGGYGKTVILKHGGNYSTVYAHLHKYANGVRSGKRVKQGQIIGYVGKSGLATGPHLHYEFRINGVHRNPLTVKLPHVESINKNELTAYKQTIMPMLVELDRLTGKTVLASTPSLLSENQITISTEEGG